MLTKVIITDLTRMQHRRVCLAGYQYDQQGVRCIRPIYGEHERGGIPEDWLYFPHNQVVRPFAIIVFAFLTADGHPPHTEDQRFDPQHKQFIKLLNVDEQRRLLHYIEDTNGVKSIFGTSIIRQGGCYIEAGTGSRSLGTISVRSILLVDYKPRATGKWDYRLDFVDQVGDTYSLAVTDLAFRRYLDQQRLTQACEPDLAALQLEKQLRQCQVYLRIGLARGWEQYPDRCYLQITGVHTFPDYLEGHCFADFTTAPLLDAESGSMV